MGISPVLSYGVVLPLTSVSLFIGMLILVYGLARAEMLGFAMMPGDLGHVRVGEEIGPYMSANYLIDGVSGEVFGPKNPLAEAELGNDVVIIRPLFRALLGQVFWTGNIYGKVGIITREDDGTPTISYMYFGDDGNLVSITFHDVDALPYKITIGLKSDTFEINGGIDGSGHVMVSIICTICNLQNFLKVGPDFYHIVSKEVNAVLTALTPKMSLDDFITLGNVNNASQFIQILGESNEKLYGVTNGGIQGLEHFGIRIEGIQIKDVWASLQEERQKKGAEMLKGEARVEQAAQNARVLEQEKIGAATQAQIDMIRAEVAAKTKELMGNAEYAPKLKALQTELDMLSEKGLTGTEIADIQRLKQAMEALPRELRTLIFGGKETANLLTINPHEK